MMIYNWQLPDWPNFQYDLSSLQEVLFNFAQKTSYVTGSLNSLPEDSKSEIIIDFMVTEAIKTSEIEGEYLSRKDVVSSIRNYLGFNQQPELIKDKQAQSIAELMIEARKTYKEALTPETLLAWHKILFSNLPSSIRLRVGAWRTHKEPMQIISGHHGNWVVHYEAPPSKNVPMEMKRFVQWFNNTAPEGQQAFPSSLAPVRAAIAHLYFESIHPFEDGNGRIGRVICEKALSQSVERPALLNLSKTIEANKEAYYDALREASQINEITSWLSYFTKMLVAAQTGAEEQVLFILKKTRYFDKYEKTFNLRQAKVIKRMLREWPESFEGGINARKYCAVTKSSKATATRDLQELLQMGALIQIGAGRSTRYEINLS